MADAITYRVAVLNDETFIYELLDRVAPEIPVRLDTWQKSEEHGNRHRALSRERQVLGRDRR